MELVLRFLRKKNRVLPFASGQSLKRFDANRPLYVSEGRLEFPVSEDGFSVILQRN